MQQLENDEFICIYSAVFLFFFLAILKFGFHSQHGRAAILCLFVVLPAVLISEYSWSFTPLLWHIWSTFPFFVWFFKSDWKHQHDLKSCERASKNDPGARCELIEVFCSFLEPSEPHGCFSVQKRRPQSGDDRQVYKSPPFGRMGTYRLH